MQAVKSRVVGLVALEYSHDPWYDDADDFPATHEPPAESLNRSAGRNWRFVPNSNLPTQIVQADTDALMQDLRAELQAFWARLDPIGDESAQI